MKRRLFTPGPTPVPQEVKLSQAGDILHHRTSQFARIFQEVCEDLKYLFQTQNDVLTFAASGTGAMEAAVANLLSPGDTVIVVKGGKFGERWDQICRAFGVNVVPIDVEWGKAVDPDRIGEDLKRNREIKAVFTQLVETSTGVVNDINSISKIVSETSAILVVDAISGLGGEALPMDDWEVDVVVAGSQKGIMLPPGLSFVALSEKAWSMVDNSTLPKYYWDFKKTKKSLKKGQTPYTPAISLIMGLRESLRLIKKEGLEKVLERHRTLARATRGAVSSLGLQVFGDPPCNVVTAVSLPQNIGDKEIRDKMRDEYGVVVAGGQGKLSGRIIRIAHLGWMDKLDMISVISALEMSLIDSGYQVEFGKGITAAEEVFTGKLQATVD